MRKPGQQILGVCRRIITCGGRFDNLDRMALRGALKAYGICTSEDTDDYRLAVMSLRAFDKLGYR